MGSGEAGGFAVDFGWICEYFDVESLRFAFTRLDFQTVTERGREFVNRAKENGEEKTK